MKRLSVKGQVMLSILIPVIRGQTRDRAGHLNQSDQALIIRADELANYFLDFTGVTEETDETELNTVEKIIDTRTCPECAQRLKFSQRIGVACCLCGKEMPK